MDRSKVEFEYIFKASPAIVYQFLTEPNCLIRWFCDEVDITDEHYSFFWEGAAEEAELVDDIQHERVRFEFEDYEDDEYLEFRLSKSPVTNETIVEITDYCDSDEVDEHQTLWNSQMDRLRAVTGG